MLSLVSQLRSVHLLVFLLLVVEGAVFFNSIFGMGRYLFIYFTSRRAIVTTTLVRELKFIEQSMWIFLLKLKIYSNHILLYLLMLRMLLSPMRYAAYATNARTSYLHAVVESSVAVPKTCSMWMVFFLHQYDDELFLNLDEHNEFKKYIVWSTDRSGVAFSCTLLIVLKS